MAVVFLPVALRAVLLVVVLFGAAFLLAVVFFRPRALAFDLTEERDLLKVLAILEAGIALYAFFKLETSEADHVFAPGRVAFLVIFFLVVLLAAFRAIGFLVAVFFLVAALRVGLFLVAAFLVVLFLAAAFLVGFFSHHIFSFIKLMLLLLIVASSFFNFFIKLHKIRNHVRLRIPFQHKVERS